MMAGLEINLAAINPSIFNDLREFIDEIWNNLTLYLLSKLHLSIEFK